MLYWLVVDLPVWKIWKSVGIILPNIWENKKSKPPTSHVISTLKPTRKVTYSLRQLNYRKWEPHRVGKGALVYALQPMISWFPTYTNSGFLIHRSWGCIYIYICVCVCVICTYNNCYHQFCPASWTSPQKLSWNAVHGTGLSTKQ